MTTILGNTYPVKEVKSFGFIGRCPVKGCKSVLRVNVAGKSERKYTRGFIGVPGSAQPYNVTVPSWSPYQLFLHCATHKYELRWKQIDGVFNEDHVCDARCTSAIGHNCECSCGGANHGADHCK